MQHTKIYLLFFYLVFGVSHAQHDFSFASKLPKVIHYARKDFKGDPQFWTVCEQDNGEMIFSNNDGALVFDGENWQKISLPNNSSIRSLVKTTNGKIYAGGYNELGVIQKNAYGRYFYSSLTAKLRLEGKNFENLWQAHQYNKQVIFRSFSELILISHSSAIQIPSYKSFTFSAVVGNRYLVQDANHGIYQLDVQKNELTLLFPAAQYHNEELAEILPAKDANQLVLVTKSGEIYTGDFRTNSLRLERILFEKINKDQVTSVIKDKQGNFLMGTLSSKILKLSANFANTQNDHEFSALSNSTIHKLYRTAANNIWVLQNNGLDFVDYNSPFQSIFDQASVYDILCKNQRVYLATNNGLYISDLVNANPDKKLAFNKLSSLQGQSWSIQDCEGDVVISHDTGIYHLVAGTAHKIEGPSGFWKLTKIKNKKGWYLGSNYNGLYLVVKEGTTWTIKNKVAGFDESTRDILADDAPNTYWVCHGYKGVYKIHLNSSYSRVIAVENFTNQNGFSSAFNINVYKWQNKIVFTTNTGIYTYDKTSNRFVPFKELNALVDPRKNTRKLVQFQDKTWFVQDDEAGFFYTQDPSKKLVKDLFLNLKGTFNRGMECIYPLHANKVIFGTNYGVMLYNLGAQQQKSVPTQISSVTYIHNQKINYIKTNSQNSTLNLPNQTDILRFEFAAPKMMSSTAVNYSYKLENVDENWSVWQSSPFKEYTHLRPGNYTFLVKSRNLAGIAGNETKLEFTILPKWYETKLAFFLYLILSIYLIYTAVEKVKKKIAFERRKSELEIQKNQHLLELELEKLKLFQDRETIQHDKLILEEDLLGKSKELANYTLLLSQKKNIFNELQADLKQLKELVKSDEPRRKIMEIFHKLNQHKIGEEFMVIFDVNFERIHHDFFEKLKKIDPSITERELRLCAFVKMNLTNKEIAPLLNISIRGIESARYRVRKKLNVQLDDNFVSFLQGLDNF
jgi:DNA-binding CsgD family transcriptional regulator